MAPEPNAATNDVQSRTTILPIRATGVQPPLTRADQILIKNDLAELIGDALLENHGVRCEAIDIGFGPEYVQIPAKCPNCGTPLDLTQKTPVISERVGAIADCHRCEYTGRASYRLVDLTSSAATSALESAVKAGDVTPEYHTY